MRICEGILPMQLCHKKTFLCCPSACCHHDFGSCMIFIYHKDGKWHGKMLEGTELKSKRWAFCSSCAEHAGAVHACARRWRRAAGCRRCARRLGARPRAPMRTTLPLSAWTRPCLRCGAHFLPSSGSTCHSAICQCCLPSMTIQQKLRSCSPPVSPAGLAAGHVLSPVHARRPVLCR